MSDFNQEIRFIDRIYYSSASIIDRLKPSYELPSSVPFLSTGVLFLGASEAGLLMSAAATTTTASQRSRSTASNVIRNPISLALRYSVTNFIPSFVWKTIPGALNSVSIGPTTSQSFVDNAAKVSSRRTTTLIELVRCSRYALASYGLLYIGLSSVLNDHHSSLTTNNSSQDLASRTLWKSNSNQVDDASVTERIVRFTDRQSPVTRTSIKRHGSHVNPVVLTKEVMPGSEASVSSPHGWHWLNSNILDAETPWELLGVHERWMLTTDSGEKLMVVELDCTGDAPDVKAMAESLSRFRSFLSSKQSTLGFSRLVTVAVADAKVILDLEKSNVDVILNADVLLAREMADFAQRNSTTGRVNVEDTSSSDSYLNSVMLTSYLKATTEFAVSSDDSKCDDLPHLISGTSTTRASEMANALMEEGVSPNTICISTTVEDEEYEKQLNSSFHVLQKSVVIDSALQLVREKLRRDTTIEDINTDNLLKFGTPFAFVPNGYRTDRYSKLI